MSEYATIQEAAKRLNKSESQVRRMCHGGQLIASKIKGHWRIDRRCHVKLAEAAETDNLNAEVLRKYSARKIERAQERLGTVSLAEKYAAAYVAATGGRWSDGFALYAAEHGLSKATLYRWKAKYDAEGLAGLIDTRGGNQCGDDAMSPEAWQYFLELYLTQQQRSVRLCLLMVELRNKREGRNWEIPSLRTMRRYAQRRIPESVRVLHREGSRAYVAKCAPYIETDIDSIEPGQAWVGDHSPFNCFVRYRGRWVRPWVTAWLDMRSRMLVGWCVCPQPNQTTVLTAMRRGVKEHGPPAVVKIDNGKDYDSEMWTGVTKAQRKKRTVLPAGYISEGRFSGIYDLLHIDVSFAIPYNARAKCIERLFTTIDAQFTVNMATYCGSNPQRKPEQLKAILEDPAVIESGPTLEQFAEQFGRYAEAYNNLSHSGKGMDGRSPAEVMAGRESRRCVKAESLDMALSVWSPELKIGKNGVRFRGVRYGQYDPVMQDNCGTVVRLAYDPDDVSQVSVYEAATTRLLCVVTANRLVGLFVNDEALREGMRQQRRARRRAETWARDARIGHTDIPDLGIAAMAEKHVVRPRAKRPRLRVISTRLDDQAAAHKDQVARQRRKQVRKKAAGADSAASPTLDLDFSQFQKRETPKSLNLDLDLGLLIRDGPDEETDLGLFGGHNDEEAGNRRPGA
ncbi:MAG: DNA-binding domain-containing protein [Planctomycetota bacterium]